MNFTATQAALTVAFNTVSVAAIAFTTTAFVVEAAARWNAIGQEAQRPQDVEQLQDEPQNWSTDDDITIAELNAWDERFADVEARPMMEDRIVPFVRPQRQPAEDYSAWTVAELRSLFNRKGLAATASTFARLRWSIC